jgi:F-type H+-transporting ATPase subunit a
MPEHSSFWSYLVAMFPALGENMKNLGHSLAGKPVTAHSAEPMVAAIVVVLLLLGFAAYVRGKITNYDESVIPDDKLSARTLAEVIVGYFYNMMKDMMGAKKAKRYFPLIGTCACFILASNVMGLIPGFNPPTSSWNVTAGCAIIVFVAFNYYGIKENGMGYFKHLAGPVWWMAWLIFPLELLSLFIRPITLSLRLMLNLAVDHVLLGIIVGLVPFGLLVPIPIMMLGTLIALVQVLVFCLLSSIYISLATEHEEGHGSHAHGHAAEHGEHEHAEEQAHA